MESGKYMKDSNHIMGWNGNIKNDKSPYCKLYAVDMNWVRWTFGFWAERFQQCREVTIEHLYQLMDDPEQGHALTNLKIAAGLEAGEFAGTHWQDEWVYKWIEAAAYVYGAVEDAELDKKMDEIIDIIQRAQQPDGYIATQITVRGWKRFQSINHHELYVMGHLITAACIHHKITGKMNFLDIAVRVADYLYSVFIKRKPELAHFGFNPSYIMALVELYRTTGERKYLELANVFIDMRGSQPGGSDQNQDRIPLRREDKIVGHSVLSTYLYCGAADAYMETGDSELLEALDRIWNNMVGTKMYINGGICAVHRGFFVRDSVWRADDVHEAVGAEYELPNSTAYNETCAQIGNFMWNWRMLHITGEARFADLMEHSLYNSILSGIDLEGMNWFYTNVLRWYGSEHFLLSNDSYQRFKPQKDNICCPSNLLRTIAGLHNYLYSVSPEGLWVHFYGGNRFDGKLMDGSKVVLSQQTNYPWEGSVRLVVEDAPDAPFEIKLRVPAWAEGAELAINGVKEKTSVKPGSYIPLLREWKAGDEIILELPMRVRMLKGHPKIESTRNQIAVMRGPVLYCLESVDLPKDVLISEIYIPREIQLKPEYRQDILGGIIVLEGDAARIEDGEWSGSLYREAADVRPTPCRIRLIPYYAWCNRGVSEMTVWLSRL